MKLNLNATLVAAICQFKAVDDIRFYLNGVYVAPLDGGGSIIVAANGHALGLWRDETGEVERPAILRIEKKLESACAGKGERHLRLVEGRLTVVDKKGGGLFVQHREGNKESSWEVEGKFPDWSKVIPRATTGPSLVDGLNPIYVAMVGKALTIGKGKDYFGVSFHQPVASGGILVACKRDANFLAVIMPMRDSTGMFPEWVLPFLKPVEPDAPLPEKQPSDAEPVAA